MSYVAVKGGEQAIDAAHKWLADKRRGDRNVEELVSKQISEQMGRLVDRVMSEGGLYDPSLAAIALKQAQGDPTEAAMLLRAYRTTLPRFAHSEPVRTEKMLVERRISAIYKDLPGGQLLGPTYDYTHRLIDFDLAGASDVATADALRAEADDEDIVRVCDLLDAEDVIEVETEEQDRISDLTREPLCFPPPRDMRLQALSRADEGFLLSMAYSTIRGYGQNHPFVGEVRFGHVAVEIAPPEIGFGIDLGTVMLTECNSVNQFKGSRMAPAQFTRGYGIVFGQLERKTIAMATIDRAMRAESLGEDIKGPAQDVEFMLSHCDSVEATGFIEHFKLPHYVDFQSEMETVRAMRRDAEENRAQADKMKLKEGIGQ